MKASPPKRFPLLLVSTLSLVLVAVVVLLLRQASSSRPASRVDDAEAPLAEVADRVAASAGHDPSQPPRHAIAAAPRPPAEPGEAPAPTASADGGSDEATQAKAGAADEATAAAKERERKLVYARGKVTAITEVLRKIERDPSVTDLQLRQVRQQLARHQGMVQQLEAAGRPQSPP